MHTHFAWYRNTYDICAYYYIEDKEPSTWITIRQFRSSAWLHKTFKIHITHIVLYRLSCISSTCSVHLLTNRLGCPVLLVSAINRDVCFVIIINIIVYPTTRCQLNTNYTVNNYERTAVAKYDRPLTYGKLKHGDVLW